MTVARHYRVSVVLVEHHAPFTNPRLDGNAQLRTLLVLHVLQLCTQSMLFVSILRSIVFQLNVYYYTLVTRPGPC